MGRRFVAELPSAAEIGTEAAKRALSRHRVEEDRIRRAAHGPRQPGRRASRRLAVPGRSRGGSLQQKRSFLEGKLGQAIGSARLTLTDDPLLAEGPRRPASTTEKGSPRKRMPIFEAGVLRSLLRRHLLRRKLKMRPTTGGCRTSRGRSGRSRRRSSSPTSRTASSSRASWAATRTPPRATSRSACRASASAAGSSRSRSPR